jgi:hypothetical protein
LLLLLLLCCCSPLPPASASTPIARSQDATIEEGRTVAATLPSVRPFPPLATCHSSRERVCLCDSAVCVCASAKILILGIAQ